MMKISETSPSDERRIVKLEGELTGPWVELVAGYCGRYQQEAHRLTLDVGDITFADREGVMLLKELAARRVELTNCTAFLAELLRADGSVAVE